MNIYDASTGTSCEQANEHSLASEMDRPLLELHAAAFAVTDIHFGPLPHIKDFRRKKLKCPPKTAITLGISAEKPRLYFR